MANEKYDHTSVIMTPSDWRIALVKAYLFSGASYDPLHTLLSEVRAGGAVQKNVTELQNLVVGEGGECKALPAKFPVTDKEAALQVVLVWERDTGEENVLVFYDMGEADEPLGLKNNGTLIVRPTDHDQVTGLGTWFTL